MTAEVDYTRLVEKYAIQLNFDQSRRYFNTLCRAMIGDNPSMDHYMINKNDALHLKQLLEKIDEVCSPVGKYHD
jgi:hypothetical protein